MFDVINKLDCSRRIELGLSNLGLLSLLFLSLGEFKVFGFFFLFEGWRRDCNYYFRSFVFCFVFQGFNFMVVYYIRFNIDKQLRLFIGIFLVLFKRVLVKCFFKIKIRRGKVLRMFNILFVGWKILFFLVVGVFDGVFFLRR